MKKIKQKYLFKNHINKIYRSLILPSAVFLISFTYSQAQSHLKLWYNKPSGKIWENALPIGNGKLGAMIYGNVKTETILYDMNTLPGKSYTLFAAEN